MYITLKEIGKILFVSVLRILVICKFVGFTTVFTEEKTDKFQTLQRQHKIFRVRKLISTKYIQLILPFIASEENKENTCTKTEVFH